jgi:hypothetical protein
MWHAWGGREMYTEFWWGNLKEIYHLENLCITERIILKCTTKTWEGVDWINLAQTSGNGSLFLLTVSNFQIS